MLTSFVEERPVKRLKGGLELRGEYGDGSLSNSDRTSPEESGTDEDILPAQTPEQRNGAALGLLHDPFVGGLTDDSLQHASSCQLRSCQLQSLQRRFDQQQKIVTPSIEKIESNIAIKREEGDITAPEQVDFGTHDIDGFVLHSQPTYERILSQRLPDDDVIIEEEPVKGIIEGCVTVGKEIMRAPSSDYVVRRCSSRSLEETLSQPHVLELAEAINTEEHKTTPAVHSADRIQLNPQDSQNFFPIFRSKKDCKTVYIIRHGESEFNAACSARGSSWEDPLLFDAKLTARGRSQALHLRKDVLKWQLPEDVLWITSPLTRALETLLHVHPRVCPSDFSCDSNAMKNVVVLPEVAERLSTSGDIGRKPSDLYDEFPMLRKQLEELDDVWWFTREDRPNCPYKKLFLSHEPKDTVKKRIKIFRKWIIDRPEKSFVAVGHSMFWREFATVCNNGLKQDMLRNCEWQIVHV